MKYHYTGVPTGFSLPPEKEGDPPIDVLLQPNSVVELPEDFPYVQRLVSASLLSPVSEPEPEPEKTASSSKKSKQTEEA